MQPESSFRSSLTFCYGIFLADCTDSLPLAIDLPVISTVIDWQKKILGANVLCDGNMKTPYKHIPRSFKISEMMHIHSASVECCKS